MQLTGRTPKPRQGRVQRGEDREREITVKVASETCCIKVPFVVNTNALKSGDDLVVYQQKTVPKIEPKAAPNKKGGGKGKNGMGNAKSKAKAGVI